MRPRHPYIESRFKQPIEMIRASRKRAPVPPLPPGYRLRAFHSGDELQYDDLFRTAWPDEGTLEHTLKHALSDGFPVIEHDASHELVASCVAFGPESAGHEYDGSLGWLVTDPRHGGRGLARIVAATVTNRLLEEGYARPWLQTEDDRVVAIRLYVGLGWEPHLYATGMEERWRAIRERTRPRS